MLCKSSCEAKSLKGRRTCTVPEMLVTDGLRAKDWANCLAASSGFAEKSESDVDGESFEFDEPLDGVFCAIERRRLSVSLEILLPLLASESPGASVSESFELAFVVSFADSLEGSFVGSAEVSFNDSVLCGPSGSIEIGSGVNLSNLVSAFEAAGLPSSSASAGKAR